MTVDEEIILGCAFRYALGRMTYVVGTVADELVRREPELSWHFKERIAKEIQEYQDEWGMAGMEFDNEAWNYVKWLFTKSRRVTVEANRYKTDDWDKVEAVLGEDGVYYSLQGRNKFFPTVRIIGPEGNVSSPVQTAPPFSGGIVEI